MVPYHSAMKKRCTHVQTFDCMLAFSSIGNGPNGSVCVGPMQPGSQRMDYITATSCNPSAAVKLLVKGYSEMNLDTSILSMLAKN